MTIIYELLTSYFIRIQYEQLNNKHSIPIVLKNIIILYIQKILNSKILTLKQDLQFFNLLSTKISNILKIKLLFRASEHNFSIKKFHESCDGHSNTITIIKNNFDHIFGAYTEAIYDPYEISTQRWTDIGVGHRGYIEDINAFLFLIQTTDLNVKCPVLFEIRNSELANYAVYYDTHSGPAFGHGPAIKIYKLNSIGLHHQYNGICENNCNQFFNHSTYLIELYLKLCGGNNKSHNRYTYFWKTTEYEVFEIERKY